MKKIKLTKQKKQFLTGVSALLVGGYMLLVLKNINGIIPMTIGIGVLLWKF